VVLDRITVLVSTHEGTVARLAAELARRIHDLTISIKALEREITDLVGTLARVSWP
jgi:hypothetical protein